MQLVVKSYWPVLGLNGSFVIPPGVHKVEPTGPFLTLGGRCIGRQKFWRSLGSDTWGDSQVLLEEEKKGSGKNDG